MDRLDLIHTTLDHYVYIKETIHTGNIRKKLIKESDEQKNSNYYKLLRGKDCSRYKINWRGLFINYSYSIDKKNGEYANLIDKKFFLEPKIFLREIALRPTAVYDDKGYFSLNKSYVLYPKDPHLNLKCINGILNSKLLAYFFEKKFGDIRVGGGYLQFKKQFTSKLPIILDHDYCEKISDLVDQIINRKDGALNENTADLEEQIDVLVYEMYGLSEDDIRIINKT